MEGHLNRRRVWVQAWPLIVANATSPILGLTDTAVLGHGGRVVDLAAIALGSLIFSFVYWTFGFLRMSTTGFVAQAAGAHDSKQLVVAVARPVLLGGALGTILFCSQRFIELSAFQILSGGADAEHVAAEYFRARIFGAPAALAGFGASGMLIGLGRSGTVLRLQLLTNGLNAALDLLFVLSFSWGAQGVGLGTAVAEWVGASATLFAVWRELRVRNCTFPSWSVIFERAGLLRTLRANADIMIRTLAMIFGFSLFVNQGAGYGANTLAANHLLLQLVSLSAFFLDGFANVVESFVGRAIGAYDRALFLRSLRLTSEAAGTCALALAVAIFFGGRIAVNALTDLQEVRALAYEFLPQVSCYVLLSCFAFQLDGVFIGAQWTRAMRNMSIVSAGVFFLLSQVLFADWGNRALWWSFVAYVVTRGLTLSFVLFLRLRRDDWLSAVSPSRCSVEKD